MKRIVLAAALAAGVGGLSLSGARLGFADYAEGLAALQRGDSTRALDEFRRAAEAGDARAQFRLGQSYERGDDVLQDFVIAHMWYNLAAAQGHEDATAARDGLAKRMTPEQMARAQEMARQRLAMAAPATPPAQQAAPTATAAAPTGAVTTADVQLVQRRLNAMGYQAGAIDGVHGGRTRTALKAWQADVGLPATGEITPQVVQRITEARTAPADLGPATAQAAAAVRTQALGRAEQVKLVQRQLAQAGYDPGPADGIMGSRTRNAIREWQRTHAMPVTGEVDQALLASLGPPSGSTAAAPAPRQAASSATATTRQRTALPQARGGEGDLAESGRLRPYVSQVQQELAAHGYFRGERNGVLSDRLRGAIREYEADAGLTVTGQVSEDLLDHLKFARPEVVKQQRAGTR